MADILFGCLLTLSIEFISIIFLAIFGGKKK